jgi:hypothetical protein
MPPRPRATALASFALVTLAALTGCGGSDPRPLTYLDAYGVFAEESTPLNTAQVREVTDTLFFHDAGLGDTRVNAGREKLVYYLRRGGAAPGTEPDSLVVQEAGFEFDVQDGDVLLTYSCPPTALCIPGPHLRGPLSGNSLTLTQTQTASRRSKRYRRIRR